VTITADYFLDKSHGKFSFSSREEPALRIAPGTGERIAFETTDAVYAELHEHRDLDQLTVGINPVTGPVFVEGAEPGDALIVTIHEIRLKDFGWSVSLPGTGALRHAMGAEMFTRRIPIDAAGVHVTDRHVFDQRGDAYAVLSAVGDSRLGGPTGSSAPDPLHPFTPIGSVTVHHLPKSVLHSQP
jgi:amidase